MPDPTTSPVPDESEIRQMLLALDMGAGVAMTIDEADTFAKYLSGQLAGDVAMLEPQIYNALVNAMTGLPTPEQIAAARIVAAEKVKEITGQLLQAELNKVANSIVWGFENGKHPFEIARHLDAIKGLDAGRAATYRKYVDGMEALGIDDATLERRADAMYEKLLRERKKVIAQNQMRSLTEEGHRIEAEAEGARFKVWMTTGDARVSDGCRQNEAEGVVPIKGKFPADGNKQPPRHARCRCSMSYVTSDEQKKRADKVSDRLVARTDAAKAEAEESAA